MKARCEGRGWVERRQHMMARTARLERLTSRRLRAWGRAPRALQRGCYSAQAPHLATVPAAGSRRLPRGAARARGRASPATRRHRYYSFVQH